MIVVGVDGSPGSDAALRWGLAEAKLRGVALRAVTVYEVPQLHAAGSLVAAPGALVPPAATEEEIERLRSAAEVAAQRVLADALARMGDATSGVAVESAAIEGSPAETLIDAGRSAEVLALGTRGHGGFVGLLLGSVSQKCTQHPPCPVVIVPPPGEREDTG